MNYIIPKEFITVDDLSRKWCNTVSQMLAGDGDGDGSGSGSGDGEGEFIEFA